MTVFTEISPEIDKVIIVSTRVPSEAQPISGGMAPAVKASCAYFGESGMVRGL